MTDIYLHMCCAHGRLLWPQGQQKGQGQWHPPRGLRATPQAICCARTRIEGPTLRRIVAQPVPVLAKLLLVQAFLRLGDLPLGHPVEPCMTEIYLHI